jgi:hypothetical protein
VSEPADRLLRRIERRALGLAALATLAAGVVPRSGPRGAAAVAGGALLAFTSYGAIKRGVDAIAGAAAAGGSRPVRARSGGALFLLRYALLAGMAYVMIARLRLPPWGLLCGASVTMLAAAAELVRRPR